MVGDDEIAQLFSDKYNHLYNSVSYDVDEMNSTIAEIKSDGKKSLNSDHIIYGPRILLCAVNISL